MKRLIIVAAAGLAFGACDTRTSPSRPDVDADDNQNGNGGTVNTMSPPDDPTLRALSVEPGSLAPVFSAPVTRYSASVASDTTSVTVSATPNNRDAALRIQGEARSAGESVNVAITGATTAIVFDVTSADGSTNRAYRLTVRRESDGSVNGNTNGGATLAAPANFRVTGTTPTSASLAWDLLPEATNYTLYRDGSATGTFNTVIGQTTNTVFTDLNLDPASTYFYRLQATSSSAVGVLTDPVAATTQEVARIETGAVRCTGGPIYTDTDTTVQLEVDVDVRLPDASRTAVDEVSIDLRAFGRTAFDPMAQRGSTATWATDLTIPSGTSAGTYTFPVAVAWMGLTENLAEGPACTVEVRPIDDDIVIANPVLTPNAYVGGAPQLLVVTAELTTTGTLTVDSFTADFSAVAGMAAVPMLDDGTLDDAVSGDGTFTASFIAPDTVTSGAYDIVLNVAATGSGGALSDAATLPLNVSDAPGLTLSSPTVNPATVSNNVNAVRDVTLSVTATTVGGATIDAGGITANLSAIDPALTTPVAFTDAGGGTYSYVLSVPAGTPPGGYAITIEGRANGGAVTDSIVAPGLIVDGVYLDPAITFDTISDTGALATLSPGVTMGTGTVALTSPFDIEFYGTVVATGSTFTAATNGTLGIGTTGVDLGAQVPTDAAGYLAAAGATAPLLAAFHHDPMVVDGAVTTPAQGIYTEVMGAPGAQMWIIEWLLASDATGGGSVQVQVVFYEDPAAAGADFEVRFGTMSVLSADPDDYAIVGVRDASLNDDIVLPQSTPPADLAGTAYVVTY